MAYIDLNCVSVAFPVYNMNTRSLKKNFLRVATGGHVTEDAKQHVLVKAINQMTFSLRKGDRVGLIGHNGSGKSTLLRLLAQIYEPSDGQIYIQGSISPVLDIMHGIEVEFTGYENILMRGTILGLSKKEINARITEITEFSGLGDYLCMPLRTYSSGMMMRLAFAISTSINPEILLIDEVFGVGDADFMHKAKSKMSSLVNQSSIVVIATHSDELIQAFCNKALLLESGQIKYFGNVNEALALYQG